MSNVLKRLAEAEAEVQRLRAEVAQAVCGEVGHDWHHIGGMNCGCEDGGGCSVPVHQCRKCGDSDYGDNAEATEIRQRCEADSKTEGVPAQVQ